MEIKYYNLGHFENERFDYALIYAQYRGKWIFVKHKDRQTWEIPAGHREDGEDINHAASRELYEETGVSDCEIDPICDYTVTIDEKTTYGRLFYGRILKTDVLPDSEICEARFLKEIPEKLTYPEILTRLYRRVLDYVSKKVLCFLEKDKFRNINMINFMKSYPVSTLDWYGNSILIRGRSDENWVYISSESLDEFKELIKGLDEQDKCFAVLEDWMLPYIIKDNTVRSRLTSLKLVYEGNVSPAVPKADIIELKVSDIPYIFENYKYKEYTSVEYMKERISKGIGLGIFESVRLAAWAITHDDGAIGFLHVLEEYRGKGYAMDITLAMIKRLLKMREVPFVHIEEDNMKSMNIALKLGFKPDRRIHWIKLS